MIPVQEILIPGFVKPSLHILFLNMLHLITIKDQANMFQYYHPSKLIYQKKMSSNSDQSMSHFMGKKNACVFSGQE